MWLFEDPWLFLIHNVNTYHYLNEESESTGFEQFFEPLKRRLYFSPP